MTHRPLPLGGRVYFADWGGHVHAVDARDGRPLWRKKVEDPKADWPWHGFCGTGVPDAADPDRAAAERVPVGRG